MAREGGGAPGMAETVVLTSDGGTPRTPASVVDRFVDARLVDTVDAVLMVRFWVNTFG